MSIRLRRLQVEYEQVKRLFAEHAQIHILETIGDPPERYIIEYRIKGLVEERDEIRYRDVHRAEIILGRDYPKELPRCKMLTPVFHPNIDYMTICTQDFGSAAESVSQLIVRICEMIAYQAYNTKSPRNGDAARWTEEHIDQLPLEKIDLMPQGMTAQLTQGIALELSSRTEALPAPFVTGQVVPAFTEQLPEPQFERCANCGRGGPEARLIGCVNQHLVCEDCLLNCENCKGAICILCDLTTCATCRKLFCPECFIACDGCQRRFCLEHIKRCKVCGSFKCSNCGGECNKCGGPSCREHLTFDGRCRDCTAFDLEQMEDPLELSEAQYATVNDATGDLFPDASVAPKKKYDDPVYDSFATAPLENQEPFTFEEALFENDGVESLNPGPETTSSQTFKPAPRNFTPLEPKPPVENRQEKEKSPRRISISKEEVRSVPDTALFKYARHVELSPAREKKTSGKAIASLIFGIIGIPLVGALTGLFAIIFGSMALREINQSDYLVGRKLAGFGIGLGVFDILLWIMLFGLFIVSRLKTGE
ncbi:MAG: DUF4190 domain-containing protein [Blastocatellia bacterium]|nr:DUF4190 domain-containing protein [Blastocatellia bacterium]